MRKYPFAPCLLVCVLALVAACQTVRQTDANLTSIPIADSLSLTLPSAPGYDGQLTAVQTVVATYDTQTRAFQATLNADADHLDIVMVALNGPRIMEIKWSGAGIEETRSAFTPDELSGLNILADIFLVFWPADKIIEALPEKARLVEEESSRSIFTAGAQIVEIRYGLKAQNGRTYVELINLDRGYSLKIFS